MWTMQLSTEPQECLHFGTKTSLLFMPLAEAQDLSILKSDQQ